jgi:cytochrome c oxidase subunit II
MTAALFNFFQQTDPQNQKFPPSDSYWMPKSASTSAPFIDWLYMMLYWISVVSAVAIFLAMVYLCVKYKAPERSSKDKPITDVSTHNTTLEISWSIAPLIIVVAVFVWGFKGFVDLRTPPKGAMEIQTVGQKWSWAFTYPGGYTDNVLHVPVNKPVRLVISSVDVLHSVWVPNFRVKMDAVPGRYTDLWFEATEVGEFPLECTEYCGTGHSDMLTHVVVHAPGDYEKWLKEAQKPPTKADGSPDYEAWGKILYDKKGCATCHTIDGTPKIAPTFKGFWAKGKEATSAGEVTIDENYIKESLLDPQAKIVNGYPASMPTFKGQLSDQEISAIVAFLKSLK